MTIRKSCNDITSNLETIEFWLGGLDDLIFCNFLLCVCMTVGGTRFVDEV